MYAVVAQYYLNLCRGECRVPFERFSGLSSLIFDHKHVDGGNAYDQEQGNQRLGEHQMNLKAKPP